VYPADDPGDGQNRQRCEMTPDQPVSPGIRAPLWLVGYLFALAGATLAHELTHRNSRFAKVSAYRLLGFTGNDARCGRA
jgi:hypothetical protein